MEVWIERYDAQTMQLFDCRNVMDEIEKSYQAYLKHHLKGAVFVAGYPLLYDINQPIHGRHPLPNLGLFKSFVELHSGGRLPVAYDRSAYHETDFMATRFYFLCDICGLECRILKDASGLPEQAGGPSLQEYQYALSRLKVDEIEADTNKIALFDEVEHLNAHQVLIDARAASRYRGEHEPIDKVAGHIPNALNFPFENIESKEAELLQMAQGKEAIVYCGSGMSATPLYAKLKEHEYQVKLFPGSFSAWIYQHPDNVERS